jgi:hypothetical protein
MSGGIIQMTRLGSHGRFANQLFQYTFLRVYAKMHNLDVQIPSWCGRHIYGLKDYPVSITLPIANERNGGSHLEQGVPPVSDEYVNKDWAGYGQYHTSWYAPHCEFIRDLYQPTERLGRRLRPALGRFAGRTSVGIHLRRGDYGRSIFYVTPVRWYLDWLEQNWDRLDDPILFIATEDRTLVEEFADYNPVIAEDMGVSLSDQPMEDTTYLDPDLESHDPVAMDFYPDFWLLQHVNIMLTPNSTFSFFAAMLNTELQEFWRSSLPQLGFESLDPWNAYPLTHDKAEDFRDVPGVCLDETKYWRRVGKNRYQEKFTQFTGVPK